MTEAEDMKVLAEELRSKILSRLDVLQQQLANPTNNNTPDASTNNNNNNNVNKNKNKKSTTDRAMKQELVYRLFKEIDFDGNGIVDKVEFRNMLTLLQLHYRYVICVYYYICIKSIICIYVRIPLY